MDRAQAFFLVAQFQGKTGEARGVGLTEVLQKDLSPTLFQGLEGSDQIVRFLLPLVETTAQSDTLGDDVCDFLP